MPVLTSAACFCTIIVSWSRCFFIFFILYLSLFKLFNCVYGLPECTFIYIYILILLFVGVIRGGASNPYIKLSHSAATREKIFRFTFVSPTRGRDSSGRRAMICTMCRLLNICIKPHTHTHTLKLTCGYFLLTLGFVDVIMISSGGGLTGITCHSFIPCRVVGVDQRGFVDESQTNVFTRASSRRRRGDDVCRCKMDDNKDLLFPGLCCPPAFHSTVTFNDLLQEVLWEMDTETFYVRGK